MKRFVFFILVVLQSNFICAISEATPISNITVQKVQGSRSSPPYGWTYAYDIGFSNLEVNVGIGIRLTGYTPSSTLKAVWENGIESMWGRQFDIIDTEGSFDYHYHVNFDVRFYDYTTSSAYHTVTVTNGTGSGNMLNWYTTSAWGEYYNGAYVAHEVGHMFSLYDEYSGGAVNPTNPIIDYSSIMGSLAEGAKDRHYNPFLSWLQSKAPGHQLSIGEYDPDWVIPEPSSLLLLALGSILLKRGRKQ